MISSNLAVGLYAAPSDLGWMALVTVNQALAQLAFGGETPQEVIRHLDQSFLCCEHVTRPLPTWNRLLTQYAAGKPVDLRQIPVWLNPALTSFQRRVLEVCREIPYGQNATYGMLARRAGYPRAARAVGNVMASNRIPLVIPCHRVVPAGGAMGHYSAANGVHTKLRLLEMEGCRVSMWRERLTAGLRRQSV